ncbi:MAG: hypothetical protein I3273_05180 [Candidatus Moeniiplasma glomeromycotorum]|nr:hypothetical protein [Candidatus Moeniiplasma glomeromycotorum]MCE8168307.1 hypothetical protein [Candidatus Moeniiplasma glomeromycotorum]MCE8169486.1 hypothetical protein [Candidatus Moeniiplasma glomeromycotorum]
MTDEIKINSLSNFSESIQKLAQAKGVSEEKIKAIIRQSFCQFYERKLNRVVDFHFDFGDKLSVYRLYQIVEKANDPEKEIASTDPRLKEGKSENGTFFLPLEIADFSFDFVSDIKNMVQQELKEIDWESQFKLLQKFQQEETLVRGNLAGLKGDYYLVSLNVAEGKVTGYWEKKEWISTKQQPRLGQSLLFLIKQVNEKPTPEQPPFLLTRASDAFFLKVLKLEIPELKEGIIVVRQISRSPEAIKIVVESKKKEVDPIGTCIGIGAIRIRSISHSLFPEKIDIVSWWKEKRNLADNRRKLSEEVGSYKNIQLRTSEDTSEKKDHPWTKKFNVNK